VAPYVIDSHRQTYDQVIGGFFRLERRKSGRNTKPIVFTVDNIPLGVVRTEPLAALTL